MSELAESTKKAESERIPINKVVGRIDDVYYFCEDLFDHGSFKGATGEEIAAIPKREYDDRMSDENVMDCYEDAWRKTVSSGRTKLGLVEWVQDIVCYEGEEVMFDPCDYEAEMQIRAITGFDEDDYPVLECVGCGRIFSDEMTWDEIYEPEVWEKIREYEGTE